MPKKNSDPTEKSDVAFVPALSIKWLIGTLVLAKLILLLCDPHVRFFLGDSATYLHSAKIDVPPLDRSYTYPLLIRYSAFASHSLHVLLFLQTVFGIFTAILLYWILRRFLGVSPLVAAFCAGVLALEPCQLFYERMVMAEAAGQLCLIGMLAAGFCYLRTGLWTWLAAIALCGILTISFRLSLLPLVLGFSVLPPLIFHLSGKSSTGLPPQKIDWLRCGLHLFIALILTATLHAGYRHWYGKHVKGDSAYIAQEGYFRLGLLAPLVKPEHFAGLQVPADILADVDPSLHERRMREAQIWAPHGLDALLRSKAGEKNGNLIASTLAERALRDDPLGLVRLSLLTVMDYFDETQSASRMLDDLGNNRPDTEMLAHLSEHYNYDASHLTTNSSLIARYFGASRAWLVFCLFALIPVCLIMLTLLWRTSYRSAALLLAATSSGLTLSTMLFSHIISFRYLHPFPLLLLLNLGVVLQLLWSARERPSISSSDN